MKAVRFHEYGDPSVLRYEDADDPTAGDGQVRIKVAATAFNGVDANIRAGFMQEPMPMTLPHILGADVAGTVDQVGPGVTGRAVGDRVIGFLLFNADGASAEYVVAPAEVLAAAPTAVPLVDAAALPSIGLTAWQALFRHADLQTGQRILVNGAAGGVGGYAVQLAKAAGAYVVATSSPGMRSLVESWRPDEIIDHTATDVAAAVAEPVDVLLNLAPITPDQFTALVGRVRDGGVVVSTTVWMPAPSDDARGVRAVDMFVEPDAAELAGLVERVDRGELAVDIAERRPLDQLRHVHEAAAAGELHGKVVVVVDAG